MSTSVVVDENSFDRRMSWQKAAVSIISLRHITENTPTRLSMS